MARRNPERRAALLDAAVEVLAGDGARGLTFRAVDQRAGVPAGTASNYFAGRAEILTGAGERVYQRLLDQALLTETLDGPRDRARVTELTHALVDRVSAFPTGFLALLELRLEAARSPELREVLTARVRADLRFNAEHHAASGLPGDGTTVALLWLALNWLVLERLTLPDLLTDDQRRDLVTALVDRLLAGQPERAVDPFGESGR
ncbi:TetR/AcrR family transcriptional regulator [Actinosynnema mirum]|uniref:Transcriptional regulator, TetR family n=1 Tax=Actinosynnema mirum (strain ATCC 29888 / DSM 43827 / JCM 3225 / NBRC 14064 / NCIMB 13271 / NRRL B-12336 / IMRU 3971 / 101) TaxID=446462 RepID=C6W8L8_ACTMD|nr:TetR/AcrR family transcriptional regulator [Actinosynnema mirum]ACU37117.1 transcriptional regulator, TetR family [Actinosynnema mirum DSM 43827]